MAKIQDDIDAYLDRVGGWATVEDIYFDIYPKHYIDDIKKCVIKHYEERPTNGGITLYRKKVS